MPESLRKETDRTDERIGMEVRDLIPAPDSPYNVKTLNQLAKAVVGVARLMGVEVEAEEYNEPEARIDGDLARFLAMIATAAEDYGQPLPVALEDIKGDRELTAIAAHLMRLSKDKDFEAFLMEPIASVDLSVSASPDGMEMREEETFDFASRMAR
tara:strand:+ start:167 stop:634 length:468 start_codon:yes stop_codon:yes gene_type:complete